MTIKRVVITARTLRTRAEGSGATGVYSTVRTTAVADSADADTLAPFARVIASAPLYLDSLDIDIRVTEFAGLGELARTYTPDAADLAPLMLAPPALGYAYAGSVSVDARFPYTEADDAHIAAIGGARGGDVPATLDVDDYFAPTPVPARARDARAPYYPESVNQFLLMLHAALVHAGIVPLALEIKRHVNGRGAFDFVLDRAYPPADYGARAMQAWMRRADPDLADYEATPDAFRLSTRALSKVISTANIPAVVTSTTGMSAWGVVFVDAQGGRAQGLEARRVVAKDASEAEVAAAGAGALRVDSLEDVSEVTDTAASGRQIVIKGPGAATTQPLQVPLAAFVERADKRALDIRAARALLVDKGLE